MSDMVDQTPDGSRVNLTPPPSISRCVTATSDLQKLLEEPSPTISEAINQLETASLNKKETTPLRFNEVVEGNDGKQYALEYTTDKEREDLLHTLADDALSKEKERVEGKSKKRVRFALHAPLIQMEVIQFNGKRYRLEYATDTQRTELMTELALHPNVPLLAKADVDRNAYGYLCLDGDEEAVSAQPLRNHFKRVKKN